MVALVVLDQLTKQLALRYLGSGKTIDFLGGFFGLKLIFNSGAAFSLGAASTWIFTIFASLVTIAMPYFMYRMGEAKYQYVLAVIWSGAIGNLIDRLFRDPGFGIGHVIDFIRYGDWFIGNVADIALVVGVIVLIVMQLRDESDESVKGAQNTRGNAQMRKIIADDHALQIESLKNSAAQSGFAANTAHSGETAKNRVERAQ